MYQVSEEFMSVLSQHTRVEHVRGTIGSALFSDSNILGLSISNRCSDTSDITFGSAYVGQLTATFINVAVPRGDWGGKTITLQWGVDIYDEETETTTTEWIPVGVYTVASAEWTDVGVNITANDVMEKFDRTFTGLQTETAYLYDFLSYACDRCGVTLGMDREDVEALPNGTEILGLYEENDIKTWRDFVSWLAQTAAGFITADRDGSVVVRSFADSEEVDEWTPTQRIAGSVFSDYTTLYDGISVVNIEDQSLSYYSGTGSSGDGTAINLGSNPFLQVGLQETKDRQRQNIADVAHSMEWTPFKTSLLSCLIYDLGDLVTCSDGVAGEDDLTCCLQAYEWQFKNLIVFTGYGSDPRLATGQSKTDKNLSGLLSKVENGEITYYQFKNVEDIEVGEEDETTIASIKFAANKVTDVDIWFEAKMNLTKTSDTENVTIYDVEESGDPPVEEEVETSMYWKYEKHLPIIATVRYYYDGVLIGYQPMETWNEEGYHTIHYGYYLPRVSTETSHTFVAKLFLENGTAVISENDATMLLRGQALAGTVQWEGEIDVEDITGLYDVKCITAHSIEETLDVSLSIPDDITLLDKVGTEDINELDPEPIEEGSVSVLLRNIIYNLVTEDGLSNLTDSSGDYDIVTEGND